MCEEGKDLEWELRYKKHRISCSEKAARQKRVFEIYGCSIKKK